MHLDTKTPLFWGATVPLEAHLVAFRQFQKPRSRPCPAGSTLRGWPSWQVVAPPNSKGLSFSQISTGLCVRCFPDFFQSGKHLTSNNPIWIISGTFIFHRSEHCSQAFGKSQAKGNSFMSNPHLIQQTFKSCYSILPTTLWDKYSLLPFTDQETVLPSEETFVRCMVSCGT